MKYHICLIMYFMIFSFDSVANSIYLKESYNFGGGYSDSLKSNYISYERFNIDIDTVVGYKFNSGFFYEFEIRYANIKPAIQKLESFEKVDLIDILQRIIGQKVYVSKIENIFEINSVIIFVNSGYDYIINNKLIAYLSYGVGIASLVNYQGFRSNSATHYGISMQNETGLCYVYNKNMSLCIGYNYLRSYWKYNTNKIYDEDGNTVMYNFQDFRLNSHAVFVNFRFML